MSNADILGLFIWHELMTTDPQGAAAFYSGLLPWNPQPSSTPDYMLWMSGSTGVGGLMAQPEEVRGTGTPPSWLVYLGTADVDATVEAAQRLGARVLKAPTDIASTGRFAVLADPQGATFAVFTPDKRATAGTAEPGAASGFSWHELATTDPQAALDFYSQLFGWSPGPAHDMGAGNLYHIIERRGAQVGGAYRQQDPSKPAYWLTYVKVDALEDTVSAARAAGGQVVQEPHGVPGGDRVARILDPQGGAIALHETRKAAGRARPAAPSRKTASAKRPARKSARRKATLKRAAARSARPARAKKKAAVKAAARKSGKRAAGAKRPARKVGKVRAAAKTRSAQGKGGRPKVAAKAVRKVKRKAARRR